MTSKRSRRMQVASRKRWMGVSLLKRSELGRYMRRVKGAKHAAETNRSTGHHSFMRICKRYVRKLGRPLTPAERAHIRVVHREEIDQSKRGRPWVKRPRVWFGPPAPKPKQL